LSWYKLPSPSVARTMNCLESAWTSIRPLSRMDWGKKHAIATCSFFA
jgi:hypothetical protein